MKRSFIKYYLLTFLLLSEKSGFGQMTLSRMIDLPYGKLYSVTADTIKHIFQSEIKTLKGDFYGTYKMKAENIEFDYYGSADFTIQYAKDSLVAAKVEFTFYSDDTIEFRRLLNTLLSDFSNSSNLKILKEYGVLNVAKIQSYINKNCILTTTKTDSRYKPINVEFLGRSFWAIYELGNYTQKFIEINVNLVELHQHNLSNGSNSNYHGGAVILSLEVTSEALQDLKRRVESFDTIQYKQL
jgi:hypothetical protein